MEGVLARLISQCIDDSGRKPAEVAHRAGVSSSTISRILNGRVSPSIDTVAEIVAACGQQLSLVVGSPSEPMAAAAARRVLDPNYHSNSITRAGDSEVVTHDLTAWRDRLIRWSAGEPVALVQAAAEHSSVLHRPGAFHLLGEITMGQIASAGVSSEKAWAVSGQAGLTFPRFEHEVPSITVLWCEDAHRMNQLLTSKSIDKASAPHRAMLVVVPAEPELFAGTFEHDGIRYASPIQIVIDCLSVGGQARSLALAEVSTW